MDLFFIIAIIIVGLVFMFIEFFLIPGTTILTILGFIIIGIGVYFGYKEYGNATGTWLLSGSIIGLGITLYIGVKRVQSKKWALTNIIDGKMNNESLTHLNIGIVGKTVSALRPEGKAIFNESERITVYTMGEFIDVNKQIEILKIDQNKIFVKLH